MGETDSQYENHNADEQAAKTEPRTLLVHGTGFSGEWVLDCVSEGGGNSECEQSEEEQSQERARRERGRAQPGKGQAVLLEDCTAPPLHPPLKSVRKRQGLLGR